MTSFSNKGSNGNGQKSRRRKKSKWNPHICRHRTQLSRAPPSIVQITSPQDTSFPKAYPEHKMLPVFNSEGSAAQLRRRKVSAAFNRRTKRIGGTISELQLDREAQVFAIIEAATPAAATDRNVYDAQVAQLRALALSPGGLGTDRARIKAWPVLLNVNSRNYRSPSMALKAAYEAHANIQNKSGVDPEVKRRDDAAWAKQQVQVKLDVDRALGNVDVARAMNESPRATVRANLNNAVLAVLKRQPSLYYYQVGKPHLSADQ
jgi:hypothetical protein